MNTTAGQLTTDTTFEQSIRILARVREQLSDRYKASDADMCDGRLWVEWARFELPSQSFALRVVSTVEPDGRIITDAMCSLDAALSAAGCDIVTAALAGATKIIDTVKTSVEAAAIGP